MLTRVVATEFIKPATAGRTEPSIVLAERPDGSSVEVVAKFSASCDLNETSLAMEVVAACLAGDLGLPIPEPFLVEIPQDWASVVSNPDRRARIIASSSVAFGSRLVTGEYSAWNTGSRISNAMLPAAAAIFAFDAIIQNSDRRSVNPNCIVRGDDLRIFDHELAFSHRLLLGWQPPWAVGGLQNLETPGNHIFRPELRSRPIDFAPIKNAWQGLSDERISEYEDCIPIEWQGVSEAVKAATKLIQDARDRIDGCISEIKRVLT